MAHVATLHGPRSYTIGPTNTVIRQGQPAKLQNATDVQVVGACGFLVLEKEADGAPAPVEAALEEEVPDPFAEEEVEEEGEGEEGALDGDADEPSGEEVETAPPVRRVIPAKVPAKPTAVKQPVRVAAKPGAAKPPPMPVKPKAPAR